MHFIIPVLRHGGNTVRTGAQYAKHPTPQRDDIQTFIVLDCFVSFSPSWLDFLGTAFSAYFAFLLAFSHSNLRPV
jgi:hypothetical protein